MNVYKTAPKHNPFASTKTSLNVNKTDSTLPIDSNRSSSSSSSSSLSSNLSEQSKIADTVDPGTYPIQQQQVSPRSEFMEIVAEENENVVLELLTS